MGTTPTFKEDYVSQIPALQLLMNLGYSYIPPEKAFKLRGQRLHNVVLTEVLEAQLHKLNQINFKAQHHEFSDTNIQEAIRRLTEVPNEGLVRTNEKLYELLTFGTTLTQSIEGDTKSFSLKYIDWEHPENNVFHVTDEFEVERSRSNQTRRPDIVCFVNGIPLVVIECKRPDKTSEDKKKAVYVGISQHLRNQREEEIPHLFHYSQLLASIDRNNALFGTTNTPLEFWALWREQHAEALEPVIRELINKPLGDGDKDELFRHREDGIWARKYFDELEMAGERFVTAQDQFLYHLMRPTRLLELIYQYIVFDGGIKKIARYQQYFAVKETVERVTQLNLEGTRTGGVIWHTTGSGKSLTMVMLAKVLSLRPEITNPKVILVTDRVNLDKQIHNTFRACGKNVVKAGSGEHLSRLVRDTSVDIITTIIDKFEGVTKRNDPDPSINIFVLVDESHRSQYGVTHATMRLVFPNACYIGFTGTPLLKKEKSTAARFGSFIHSYSIRQAVIDEAVVPLLYEGRMAELEQNQASIDLWFERVTKDLTEEQKVDLKRKFSRKDVINQADQRIQQIAYDIIEHYTANFKGTGFKSQLAAQSKAIALKYKEYLDDFGGIRSAVIISPPDTREGNETVNESVPPKLQAFWNSVIAQYGTEEKYEDAMLDSFSHETGIELLIVVDKLLAGFDEPRNTVLYLDKPLKEHGLLQAISRVNRLFEGKQFGYIVDYRGVLGELNETLQTYDALAGFDPEDVIGTIFDVGQVIAQLPQLHSALWSIFQPVANKQDVEQLERFLEPENRRQEFYKALQAYAKALQVALATVDFFRTTPEADVNRYKRDLAFFNNLRSSVKLRYAETVDYGVYEKQIRKLMDRHIASPTVVAITEQVNIFDTEAFEAVVEQAGGQAAKADTIAYQMKRSISEKMEQDPAFYKKFSDLIEETIEAYKQERIEEAEYYKQVKGLYSTFTDGRETLLPTNLRHRKHAAAYYGIIGESLKPHASTGLDADVLAADVALQVEEIIEQMKIRDWVYNSDVQNRMRNALDDCLIEFKEHHQLPLTWDEIDAIVEQIVHTAKQRNNL